MSVFSASFILSLYLSLYLLIPLLFLFFLYELTNSLLRITHIHYSYYYFLYHFIISNSAMPHFSFYLFILFVILLFPFLLGLIFPLLPYPFILFPLPSTSPIFSSFHHIHFFYASLHRVLLP